MSLNLQALFAGRHEAIVLPPKRRPGRPPGEPKRMADEMLRAASEADALLQAVASAPADQLEAYDERLGHV